MNSRVEIFQIYENIEYNYLPKILSSDYMNIKSSEITKNTIYTSVDDMVVIMSYALESNSSA